MLSNTSVVMNIWWCEIYGVKKERKILEGTRGEPRWIADQPREVQTFTFAKWSDRYEDLMTWGGRGEGGRWGSPNEKSKTKGEIENETRQDLAVLPKCDGLRAQMSNNYSQRPALWNPWSFGRLRLEAQEHRRTSTGLPWWTSRWSAPSLYAVEGRKVGSLVLAWNPTRSTQCNNSGEIHTGWWNTVASTT